MSVLRKLRRSVKRFAVLEAAVDAEVAADEAAVVAEVAADEAQAARELVGDFGEDEQLIGSVETLRRLARDGNESAKAVLHAGDTGKPLDGELSECLIELCEIEDRDRHKGIGSVDVLIPFIGTDREAQAMLAKVNAETGIEFTEVKGKEAEDLNRGCGSSNYIMDCEDGKEDH